MPVQMLKGAPVADLIAALQKLPPGAVVVSGEGYSHDPLYEVAEATFVVQWPLKLNMPPIIAAILAEAEDTPHD